MKRLLQVSLFLVLTSVFAVSLAQAGLINHERRNRNAGGAAANTGTGKPAPAPKAAVAMPSWKTIPPVAASKVEQRYDTNRDGKLQTAEMKILLRDVVDNVQAKGSYTVNAAAVKIYDKNSDGIISRNEIDDIKRDTQN